MKLFAKIIAILIAFFLGIFCILVLLGINPTEDFLTNAKTTISEIIGEKSDNIDDLTSRGSDVAESIEESTSSLTEATVVRVVDGDTFVADIDGTEYKIRLIGVDTAESVHPDSSKNTEEGEEASEHTKSILPEGTTVWLEKDISDTDQYDRLLRYVWLEKPDNSNSASEAKEKMLNAQLVADGWASAVDYEPDTKWSTLFHSLEESD